MVEALRPDEMLSSLHEPRTTQERKLLPHSPAQLTRRRSRAWSTLEKIADLEERDSRAHHALTLALFVVLLAVPATLGFLWRNDVAALGGWLRRQGPIGCVAFAAFMCLWTSLFLPCTPLEVASGVVFSPWTACGVAVAGQLSSSIVSFFLGRYLWRNFLLSFLLHRFHFLRSVRSALRTSPWRLSFLVRFSFLPLYVHNYGLAVMPCPPLQYFATALASSSVYSLVWTRIGHSTRRIAAALAAAHASGGDFAGVTEFLRPGEVVLLVAGLLCAGLGAYYIQRHAGQELRRLEEQENGNASPERETAAAAAEVAAVAAAREMEAGETSRLLNPQRALLRPVLTTCSSGGGSGGCSGASVSSISQNGGNLKRQSASGSGASEGSGTPLVTPSTTPVDFGRS